MKKLLVIDMQNDFIYGALGNEDAKSIVKNVVEKVNEYFKNDPKSVIFTKDTHNENYLQTLEGKNLPVSHCIKGTKGHQIIDELKTYEDIYNSIEKESFGYIDWNSHLGTLNQDDEIELVGVCTDICVVSNAIILKALYPNTKVIVDSKCCAGTSIKNHEAALLTMKNCQIDII